MVLGENVINFGQKVPTLLKNWLKVPTILSKSTHIINKKYPHYKKYPQFKQKVPLNVVNSVEFYCEESAFTIASAKSTHIFDWEYPHFLLKQTKSTHPKRYKRYIKDNRAL